MASKVALALVVVATHSCKKESCEEPTPELTFDRYDYQGVNVLDPTSTDTLRIYYQFVDCQGDISVAQNDDRTRNLQTFLYEKVGGEWSRFYPINLDDSTALWSQVPYSSKVREGQRSEGLIEQRFGSIRQNSDTIRFITRVVDRQGNKSEWVWTDPYVLPSL